MVNAGKLATKHAKSLVKIGKSYKYDVIGADRYKRSICIIHLNKKETFNDKMVNDGYAVAFWKYIPKSEKRHFKLLSQQAKQNSRGLYKTHPAVIRCMDRR